MRYDLSRDVVGLNMYKRITEREANPLAERVLNRGEATVAPRGRADDFAWPRSNTSGEVTRNRLPTSSGRGAQLVRAS